MRRVLLAVLPLLGALFAIPARADFTKTITVVPFQAPTNAITTWYYASCTSIVAVGSFSTVTAPKHGTLTFGGLSAPLPGCPTGSPALPAVVTYYQWNDPNTTDTSDYFQVLYSVNGLTQLDDVTVNLQQPTGPCDKVLVPEPVVAVPEQSANRTVIGVGEVVKVTSTYPADWSVSGGGFINPSVGGACARSTSSSPVNGLEACFSAPFTQGNGTVTAKLNSGLTCSIPLTTIEPTGIIYKRLINSGYGFNDPTSKPNPNSNLEFWAAVFVLPSTVSFSNIGVSEQDTSQPFTTQVTSHLYTIPAANGFAAVNAWLVGCDLDALPSVPAFWPTSQVVYTWGATTYATAQRKTFATIEARVGYDVLAWWMKKGEVPLNGAQFSSYVQPYAELDTGGFLQGVTVLPPLGSCYSAVDQLYKRVPMSK